MTPGRSGTRAKGAQVNPLFFLRASTLLAALAVAACGIGGSAPVPKAGPLGFRAAVTPISHVVFIIQENRSFNNLFLNFPGAKTQNYGYDTNGQKITLKPIDLATDWDIDHFSHGFFAACDGQGKLPGTNCKMDGWNLEQAGFGAPSNFAYMYVREKQIDPYWKMAKQYVLADRMFTSNLDGSFISHQYAISAFARHGVDGPITSWDATGEGRHRYDADEGAYLRHPGHRLLGHPFDCRRSRHRRRKLAILHRRDQRRRRPVVRVSSE